jgi:hypothetical protein
VSLGLSPWGQVVRLGFCLGGRPGVTWVKLVCAAGHAPVMGRRSVWDRHGVVWVSGSVRVCYLAWLDRS